MYSPEQQGLQEAMGQQGYGMYKGVEQPYAYQGEQIMPPPVREEGMRGEQNVMGQQQFYAFPPFVAPAAILPEGRFFAILSYTLGWFSGLILLFFNWQNRFVRFHALQSLFFFGAVNVFDFIVLRLFLGWNHVHIWFLPELLLFFLVNLIAAIAWIVGMIQAGMGKYYRLPVVGDLVLRRFVPPGQVK